MELVKNIFFNTDKIVEGDTIKISYVGELFQSGSKEVYLHYGFGANWDNVGETKMEKTELGFQCTIDVISGHDTLNLCYKNENNEWDNNVGENYIFHIEKNEVENYSVAETGYINTASTENSTYDGSENDKTETNDSETEETSLTLTGETGMQIHKGLRRTYIWSKKIKLAVLKIIKYVPKIISGNYKRKVNED